MLPEDLSNGICSLNPRVDRLAFTAEMLFDGKGRRRGASVYKSVIRSDHRMTYKAVRQILVDGDPDLTRKYADFVPAFKEMELLARSLLALRVARGSLDFDLPEPEILLDLRGETTAIVAAERSVAHRIVEEFMLSANETVARHLTERGIPDALPDPRAARPREDRSPRRAGPAVRIQIAGHRDAQAQGPSEAPVGVRGKTGRAAHPPDRPPLAQTGPVCRGASRPLRPGVHDVYAFHVSHPAVPRSRRPPDPGRHARPGKQSRRPACPLADRLPGIADHSSRRERIAMEAERDVVDAKKAAFMRDKVGQEFGGVITGVTAFGVFVQLDGIFVEGLVHVSSIEDDYYRYDEAAHALVGDPAGPRLPPGRSRPRRRLPRRRRGAPRGPQAGVMMMAVLPFRGGRGRGSCPETFLQDEAFDFFNSSEVSVIAYEPGCPGADCRSRLNGIGSLKEAFGAEPCGQIGDFQRERTHPRLGYDCRRE